MAFIVGCNIDAALFLLEDKTHAETRWVFLDQIPVAAGVPQPVVDLVSEFTVAMHSTASSAVEMREAGLIGHHQQLMQQVDVLKRQAHDCMDKYMRPRRASVSSAQMPANQASPRISPETVASVALALQRDHYCVLDKFISETDGRALHALLREMRASEELQPGEVSGGLKKHRRGDLMRWVSIKAGAQPPPLFDLLTAIDGLVGALSTAPQLEADLGRGRQLMRHEMQVTCYPGGGARYVKHVDDALAHRGRVLTCIAYVNPTWEAAHGGNLRVHVHVGQRDIDPLHRRLVLFWSDSRVPHEVLPAYADRYAVSVWYSDSEAVLVAAQADHEAKK